jgi:hypothetical protein
MFAHRAYDGAKRLQVDEIILNFLDKHAMAPIYAANRTAGRTT